MITVSVSLPEKLKEKMESCVKNGWFLDEEELIRMALREYFRIHDFRLEEQYMLDDLNWAMSKNENQNVK